MESVVQIRASKDEVAVWLIWPSRHQSVIRLSERIKTVRIVVLVSLLALALGWFFVRRDSAGRARIESQGQMAGEVARPDGSRTKAFLDKQRQRMIPSEAQVETIPAHLQPLMEVPGCRTFRPYWELLSKLTVEDKALLMREYRNRSSAADRSAISWALPVGFDPKQPWRFDLLKFLGGEQRVAYVRTRVHSEREQPARLELGTDDGVKAWLNGRLVHANNVARPLAVGSDTAEVTLQPGWNTLLLKITQNNLGWEFCARLIGRDGARLEGVRLNAPAE